jgi:hypothetical protein
MVCVLTGNAASTVESPAIGLIGAEPAVGASEAAFEIYLDRLMKAESNGRDTAANPRSTALGPFQFIKATFIEVARRHFAVEVGELSDQHLLGLRTDRNFARRAAAAYSRDSLALLSAQGLQPTFGHLRLAFLVGPMAAARLMQADPQTPAAQILGATVVRANPFMDGMTAADLVARATRDIGDHGTSVAVAPAPHERTAVPRPGPRVSPRPAGQGEATVTAQCNQKLVACRRWIAMQSNRQRVAQRVAARQETQAGRAASRQGSSGRRENRPGV